MSILPPKLALSLLSSYYELPKLGLELANGPPQDDHSSNCVSTREVGT